jgi:8-oxo-dGTP diphosphatase
VSDRALVELRCSAIVFRGEAVLLLGRDRHGRRDWVLPGGHPRPREGTATCAWREVVEETGLDVQVGRVAFVLETTDPAGDRRLIEIVFLATERDAHAQPKAREPGLWPQFVPVDDTPMLDLRPPIAGYLRGLHRTRLPATAPYLGNLWREPADGAVDSPRGDRGG